MFQTISNFMRVRDIRSKIFYTLLVLIVFRLGTFIPVPNVDATALQQTDNNLIGLLNVFGGGALANFSILSNGNHALHHRIHHRAIIADGCCTEIY